jgi:hypothetical protein
VILDHLEAALLCFVHQPHTSMTDVKLMNSLERQRLLPAIQPMQLPNLEGSILDLIEVQACRTPHKIAVCISHMSDFVRSHHGPAPIYTRNIPDIQGNGQLG